MGYLILVKHSLPELDPNVPAPHWHLGDEGKRRAQILAERLTKYAPQIVVSSREPKAIETAAIVAEKFGLTNRVVEGLHEHARERIGWLDHEELNRRIGEFFAKPHELVLGDETAEAARTRFSNALAPLIEQAENETTIVVTHGTVMSLYYAALTGETEHQVWKGLELPAYFAISVRHMRIVELCESM